MAIPFSDLCADSEHLRHVTLELFLDKVPQTTGNFQALSPREEDFGHNGSCFHQNHLSMFWGGG
uniref:PPIase cyclophilin-type domain-containing protein n=1 Tax=Varanus komodoensis TaxID=61221 RepID=A0A8D2JFP8_VARKO